MNKKQISQFLVALFVAVIFITSYAAFSSFGGTPVTTTKTGHTAPPTLYAAGIANATLVNYTPTLNLTVNCKNTSTNVSAKVTALLNKLQANGSVSSVYTFGKNSTLLDGNDNTIQLYHLISANTNSSSCLSYSTGGEVRLPRVIKLSVENQVAEVSTNNTLYTVPVTLSSNLSNTIKVRIGALLTQNGTLYGNLSVTRV